jgi:glycogen operon protein
MTQRDWQRGDARTIGVFLNGEEIPTGSPRGEEVVDDSFLLLFNAHHEPITFKLPVRRFGARWKLELSTAEPELEEGEFSFVAREEVVVGARSVVVLRRGW